MQARPCQRLSFGPSLGLGLGLSIVQGLVALHEGTVTAASDGPGRGAVFAVALPLQAPTTATRTPQSAPSHDPDDAESRVVELRGCRVLLVDDDAVSRKLSSKFLQVFGCAIDVAVDGVGAVNKMNLEKYDLVLMVSVGFLCPFFFHSARLTDLVCFAS